MCALGLEPRRSVNSEDGFGLALPAGGWASEPFCLSPAPSTNSAIRTLKGDIFLTNTKLIFLRRARAKYNMFLHTT